MKLQWIYAVCFLVVLGMALSSCDSDDPDPGPNEGDYEGYTLEWSDEFNGAIDPANWTYELGDGTDYGLPPGWGNSERQLYTDSQNNAIIQPDDEGNSVLAIVARKEPGEHRYSSAKLTTQGLQSFRFGRIEARVKVPQGRGMWPAFWMLGNNKDVLDWPGCGEIDIFEVIGHDPSVIHSSVHYTNDENKHESNTLDLDAGENLANDYHIYRVDWTPESLVFSIDERMVNSVPVEEDMKEFLRSFYIIFNIAVGGNWPGDPDASTVFPQRMFIDWVRVYSKDDLVPPQEPPLNIQEETIGVLANDIAQHALRSGLEQFSNVSLKSFGDGGEPDIATSDIAIDGDSSLVLSYPGEGWGGAFFVLEPTINASDLANGTLYFSIRPPADLTDIEIKLESVATAVSLFIRDYTGTDVGNGYFEYAIPMTDFDGLDLSDLKIPFAMWNPVNASGAYIQGDIFLDNVYIE